MNEYLEILGIKEAAEDDSAAPKEGELELFGFKAQKKPDHNAAWDTWSKSKRTPADNNAFLQAVDPILNKAVTSYVGAQDPVAHTRAKILALRAADGWDSSKANLQTHLLTQLQPLRRYAASRRYATKIPERTQWQIAQLKEAEKEISNDHDRPPTELELSDKMGVSIKRLRQLRGYGGQMPSGAFLEAEDEPELADNPNIKRMDMWEEMVYHDLTPVQRVVFEGRTGFNGKKRKSVEELARELGVSIGTVSKQAKVIANLLNNRPEGM